MATQTSCDRDAVCAKIDEKKADPHMRGEYVLTSWPMMSPKGSPPHTWGALETLSSNP